ncbi:MAG: CDP-alcohol phosphatidyltransferase family protein, partial [Gammaproteobacteria bacterium]|nr:CDP-alcohol phosphatidyltransferase family protein [Gammaproteobacteria bacterium]
MTVRWIPNAVSLLRIALVVPVLLLILNGSYGAALLLFMIAGFSDGLDGYLAQRLDCQTRLGALLDPVADKLLVAGVFVTLAIIGLIPVWLTTIVILRDVVIFGGAVLYHY